MTGSTSSWICIGTPTYNATTCPIVSTGDRKGKNTFIRNCLTGILFPGRQKKNEIWHRCDKKSIDKLRTMYLTFPNRPKWKKHPSKLWPTFILLTNHFDFVFISVTIIAHFVKMTLKLRTIFPSLVVSNKHSGIIFTNGWNEKLDCFRLLPPEMM